MAKSNIPQNPREFGFGKTDVRQQRLLNKDGSYNFLRLGLSRADSFNLFHHLTKMSWARFILVVFTFYTTTNLLFTALYYLVGTEQLQGKIYHNESERFAEVFFFSSQTLTTVGYGRINPIGVWASSIASFEALIGLMTFALITGLLYGRFSKPRPSIKFSEKALIAPFHDGIAFMFRMANTMESNLMNLSVQIGLGINENDSRSFYALTLERDNVLFFPSSWTIVHPIDEHSPLYGLTEAEFMEAHPEFLILVSGFDDTFDQTVLVRFSYADDDLIWGAKFVKIVGMTDDGYPTVDLSRIGDFDRVTLAEPKVQSF
jgi:inward rectifier potassium channel